MQLPMYVRECQGVELASLPAAAKMGGQPVTAKFYGELFAAIQALGPSDPKWVEGKREFGRRIAKELLHPWMERHGRKPRILALGVGEGWTECTWLEEGFDVTLHDGTEAYFGQIRQRHPEAKLLKADFAEINFSEAFDVITILALDFTMERQEFVAFLKRLTGFLTGEGAIICYCPNVLSLRRMAIDAVRRLADYHRRKGWIWWGWWRTPNEYLKAARACGLRVTRELLPKGSEAQKIKFAIPPWRESNGVFLFERRATPRRQ
jgi:hypothetical protein